MSDASRPRSYRPGAWFGIFGEHATVLLPPSEKPRVGELWGLVDGGADFDEVLDALISGGLRELPGFVLVSELDDDTKVVIRGAAAARFTTSGGEVRLTGSEATTWVERSMTGVSAMEIDVTGEGGDGNHPTYSLESGLVRVSRVENPAPVAEAPAPVAEPAAAPEPEPDTAEHATADRAEEPSAPSAPPPPSSPPPPSEDIDHDGMTRAGGWSAGSFAASRPGIPGQEPAPAVVAQPVARLVFSSGENLDVDRAVLVGRAPEARRFPSSDQPRLVTVPSPHQEISSTHLEIRPGAGADHGSAVVTDLGSTNGTVLVQPGLAPEDLRPGIAAQLIPGAVIDLGDGVTIQVVNP
ncbi:MAG: FHA domain-containing protein [Nocardioides sp.]